MTWTGEGERAGAVECRDRNGLVMLVDQGLRFFFAKPDREHPAFTARATFHESRAQSGNSRALFQREQPGNACRSDSTDAMAKNGGGMHPPRFPQLRQSNLHRENGGMCNLCTMQLSGLLGAAEFFKKRKSRDAT